MKFIDCHAHVLKETYTTELERIIKESTEKLYKVINIAWNVETSLEIIQLYEKNNMFLPVIGIHPNHSSDKTETIENLKKIFNEQVIAIGEIGLDYYRDHSDKQTQKKIFIEQLQFAREKKLPVILHIRDAWDDALEILKDYNDLKLLVHSWTGSIEQLNNYLKYLSNSYFSFNGIITFKNSEEVRKSLLNLPLERFLIETDSPWLSPDPLRGKINEPKNVIIIYEFISKLLNIPLKKITEIIESNFITFFGKNI